MSFSPKNLRNSNEFEYNQFCADTTYTNIWKTGPRHKKQVYYFKLNDYDDDDDGSKVCLFNMRQMKRKWYLI